MLRLPIILAIVGAPAIAQGSRPGDVPFTAAALSEVLAGQALTFHDGSISSYAADGGYGYVYTPDGPIWAGRWETAADSQVCVTFDNGSSRCDRIVESGDRLVLITSAGDRFPVRDIAAE